MNINFDEKSIDYIRSKCDMQGELNYYKIIREMVIRTFLDFTGSFILKWHIRSTLDSS